MRDRVDAALVGDELGGVRLVRPDHRGDSEQEPAEGQRGDAEPDDRQVIPQEERHRATTLPIFEKRSQRGSAAGDVVRGTSRPTPRRRGGCARRWPWSRRAAPPGRRPATRSCSAPPSASQRRTIVSVASGWNCVARMRPPRMSCGPTSVLASTSKPSGTVNTSSCHSIHGPLGDVGRVELVPADLRAVGAADRAAEGVRQHLGAEADRQQRDVPPDDLADEGRLGLDERGGLRPVHVPLRPERQHEVDPVERRPPLGVLAVALGEGVAAARAGGGRRTRSRSRWRCR